MRDGFLGFKKLVLYCPQTMADAQPERRKHRRIPDSFMVECRFESPIPEGSHCGQLTFTSVAIDVSEAGLAVDLDFPVKPKAHAYLTFTVLNEGAVLEKFQRRSFTLSAEVMNCRLTPDKSYRAGFLFLSAKPDDTTFLAQYVKDQRV